MKRGYADARNGQMHYLEDGKGPPVFLLHQTPVSSEVYTRLIPVLAEKYHVFALDNPGFGNSTRLPPGAPVSDMAGVVVDVMDYLKIARARVMGVHTGATFAAEVAAGWPERVAALMLVGFPFLQPEERAERLQASVTVMGQKGGLPVVKPESDGSHLMKLWSRGYSRVLRGVETVPDEVLAPHELAFVDGYVVWGLKAWESISDTFRNVYTYDGNARLPLVKAPALLLEATAWHERAYCKRSDVISKIIPGSKIVRIEGADAYCVYWRPKEVGAAVLKFLEGVPV